MDRVGVGPRAIAVIIDTLLFIVIACCFFLVVALVSGGEFETADESSILLNLASTLVYFGYFIVLEGSSGTTLGKRLLKLRVVKVDGTPITMRESAIRNILRIIDGILFYLVGAIIIWTNPNKQRLGDRLAQTIVVRDVPATEAMGEPPLPPVEQRF